MIRLKLFLGTVCISLLAIGLIFSSAIAATHITDEKGQLIGAKGVLVDGVYYDVVFVTGTAEQIYKKTSGEWVFTFNNIKEAEAAATALLEQVVEKPYAGKPKRDLTRPGSNNLFQNVFTPYLASYTQKRRTSIHIFSVKTTNTGFRDHIFLHKCALPTSPVKLMGRNGAYAVWRLSAPPPPPPKTGN